MLRTEARGLFADQLSGNGFGTLPEANMKVHNPLFVENKEAVVHFHDCWREGIPCQFCWGKLWAPKVQVLQTLKATSKR